MEERLVTLRRFTDSALAEITKAALESSGIECFLTDRDTQRIAFPFLNVYGGMRLLVRQDDVPAAEETLRSMPELVEDAEEAGSMSPLSAVVASTNLGKLRDFQAIADAAGVPIDLETFPEDEPLPQVVEDGETYAANAQKKAAAFSVALPGELVIADDSGLEVEALGGAPGVHSARYAAGPAETNASDSDNNYKLLYELEQLDHPARTARFVCVIAAAKDGKTLGTFRGEVQGDILAAPLGRHGFGYDPLFYYPPAGKTFGEMSGEEKARYSHRSAAFHRFLEWLTSENH